MLAAQAEATYTDPRGNAWPKRLDWLALGDVSQATDPLGDTTVTHRDANGFPWLTTDPVGNRTRTFFDSKENPTEIVQGDTGRI
jgi:uncharacterized protein RhaS with RHS repeats